MRILEQSPDRLVLDLRPVGLMVLCVGLFLLFLILGFGMGWMIRMLGGMTGMPSLSAVPSMPGMNLLGYASVIPLAVGVFAPKTRRLSFDRTTGLVTIATRGVLERGERTFPLADFHGSTLASRRSGNNGTTHRAVLQFKGQSVQVTPYGTSGRGPARTVQAINGWLGSAIADQSLALVKVKAAEALAALGFKLPR